MSWVRESDAIIAEVSTPSLGVGYEVSKAEDMNKPMLCLYRNQDNKRLSPIIGGNPKIKTVKYNSLKEALSHIDRFFEGLKK